jgi:hypothetical protein
MNDWFRLGGENSSPNALFIPIPSQLCLNRKKMNRRNGETEGKTRQRREKKPREFPFFSPSSSVSPFLLLILSFLTSGKDDSELVSGLLTTAFGGFAKDECAGCASWCPRASACRLLSFDTLQHVPATIALRVAARRIAVIRMDPLARNRSTVVGHIQRASALRGEELPLPLKESLDAGEQMQVQIALDRWRQEQEQQQHQGQLATAVTDLERLTALFNANDGLSGSDLMAAVEQYRLRAVITAWETLGVALRDRARRYGADHLVPLINLQQLQNDDDPVVIVSDQTDTQTLNEQDVDRLRGS